MDEVEQLIGRLSEFDENAKKDAIRRLGEIGEAAVRPLIEALNGAAKAEILDILSALEALTLIGKPALPALAEALGNGGDVLRSYVIIPFGEIGGPSVAAMLVSAMKDQDPTVQHNAANALKKICKSCITPEELSEFEEKLEEGIANLRRKYKNRRDIREVELHAAKLKMKAAKKKNHLAQDRGILLDDKPKPPKRGQLYCSLRRKATSR